MSDELKIPPGEPTTSTHIKVRDISSDKGGEVNIAGQNIIHAENVYIDSQTPPTLADETPAPGPPPFKGMQYFDVADADIFFGREQLTAKLISHLHENHFMAIVGASGSGKSSVARAGLIPALKRGEILPDGAMILSDSQRWPVHIITPTAHPLKELAASLTRDSESVTATATLMDDLACDARSLDLAISRLLLKNEKGSSHLLVLVDQFEEVFTACKSEGERRAFVDNLLFAAETEGSTIVVITLRADFYAHCAQYDNLRHALEKYQVYIGAMTTEELRRSIEAPAERGEWEYEAGLVDLLMRDVADQPGGLPLLSHALLETWKRRRGRLLTLAGYVESGGVQKAISQTADRTLAQLKPEQQAIARRIFLALTELGEGTQDTRRRMALQELTFGTVEASDVEIVLKQLADARLVTTDKDNVEIAHEALIREWPTLRIWLDENRESLRLHRRLTEATQEWQRLGRDESALYRGTRLAQIKELVEKSIIEVSQLENDFLQISRETIERELSEREAQHQREQENVRQLAAIEMFKSNLNTLSIKLVGGRDLTGLLEEVVQTIAQVMGANASSLYLLEQHTNTLVIRAAAGYHQPLVEQHVSYKIGKGITGQIAQTGKPVRFNSQAELHQSFSRPMDRLTDWPRLNSFLGLPLKVRDRFSGEEQVIGVLKIEDIQPSDKHPESFFTDQDVLLCEMMANIFAMVVYNTQLEIDRLQDFSDKLRGLSNSLAGAKNLTELLNRIVDTLAKVMIADASSLYLYDKHTHKLIIRAAAGYQSVLVEKGVNYEIGQGVTGKIAQTGDLVQIKSIDELRKYSSWRGNYDSVQQEQREPNAFLGLPLKAADPLSGEQQVIGVLKVESIRPSRNHPEAFFTDQDVLLGEMMANVIATIIHMATESTGDKGNSTI